MPFGVAGSHPGTGPGAARTVPAEPSFTATLKLTFLRHDDVLGDVCAIDDTKNPSWHAYLRTGESKDGIVADQIDPGRGVLLTKDGVSEWLLLEGATRPTAAVRTTSIPSHNMVQAREQAPVPVVSPASTAGEGTARPPDLRVESPVLTGAELDQHLLNYQKELILAGGQKGPALPFQLPPEMDDELVNAGVLPPAPANEQ